MDKEESRWKLEKPSLKRKELIENNPEVVLVDIEKSR